jgi:hypothetical protein
MAEADRDVYRREQAALAREKEIMKDVPGWEVSTTDRGAGTIACWAGRGLLCRGRLES